MTVFTVNPLQTGLTPFSPRGLSATRSVLASRKRSPFTAAEQLCHRGKTRRSNKVDRQVQAILDGHTSTDDDGTAYLLHVVQFLQL